MKKKDIIKESLTQRLKKLESKDLNNAVLENLLTKSKDEKPVVFSPYAITLALLVCVIAGYTLTLLFEDPELNLIIYLLIGLIPLAFISFNLLFERIKRNKR